MNPLSAFIFLPCCAYQLINLFWPYAILLWWIYDILVIVACLFVFVLFLWLLFTRGGYHETPLVTSTIGVSSWLIAWIIYFKKKIVIASSWRPVCCPLFLKHSSCYHHLSENLCSFMQFFEARYNSRGVATLWWMAPYVPPRGIFYVRFPLMWVPCIIHFPPFLQIWSKTTCSMHISGD